MATLEFLNADQTTGFAEFNFDTIFFKDRKGPAIQAINNKSHCVFNKKYFEILIDIFGKNKIIAFGK